jgi:hypothetical protein
MSVIVHALGVLALILALPAAYAQNKVPTEQGLEVLVKTSLLTFNDANITGNYEVLHGKLSGPFRAQFPAARLKESFKDFRDKDLDIGVISALKPAYAPAPSIDDEGRLLVKGSFPTEPNRVQFDLAFIPSDGEWKLVRLHVKVD